MKKLPHKTYISQEGFTLVELLIVIVIIGILAGVVIGILNPRQQQARAKDAAARAQLDKLALSAKSLLVSSPRATDQAPSAKEFAGGVGNSTDAPTNCTSVATTGSANCTFSLSGLPLAANCSNTFTGTGTNQCYYLYWRDSAAGYNRFALQVHGQATPTQSFVYYYTEDLSTNTVVEGFYYCPDAYNVMTGTAPNLGGSSCTLAN